MDHHDGGFGYPPYEEDPRAAGQDSGAPRAYREDPAGYGVDPAGYGVDPSQQYDPNAPYDQGYGNAQPGYGTRGYAPMQPQDQYADPENPYAPHPIDPNYNYNYPQDNSYGSQQQPYQPPVEDGYASRQNAGQYYDNPDSAYATRRQTSDYTPRAATGRTSMPRDTEGYGYTGRSNTSRMRFSEDVEEFTPRSTTGRTTMPASDGDYTARGTTSRTRYPKTDDHNAREYGDEMEEDYERPRSSKKKRSKFGKFMHALGLYLAQLPAKTLVIIGGSFAVVLAAVILLAVLLPNSDRTARPDDGQLAITDMTPTPSLAPTDTPAPTEEVSPTPSIPVLTENIVKSGTVSDLIPAIQERLVELGYMDKPADGYTTLFGPTTKTAIRLFQVKNFESSKDWDGIIGNGTYTLLMSDQAKAYYLSRGDGDDRTKVITKLVEDVTKLQNRLIELGYLTAGSATGLYGNTTVQAVKLFQEYHGISPIDGIAGQETLKMLYSADAMTAEVGKVNNRSKYTPTPGLSTSPDTSTSPSTSPTMG